MSIHSQNPLLVVSYGRKYPLKRLMRHNCLLWSKALFWALVCTYAFDLGGAKQVERWLCHIRQRNVSWSTEDRDFRVLSAKNDAMFIKAVVHLILGDHQCFADSFAIYAGLTQLGYPCHILVGFQQIAQIHSDSMHAYVLYENEPVSDIWDVQYAFIELLSYGKEQ